jgi:hypothetical protein
MKKKVLKELELLKNDISKNEIILEADKKNFISKIKQNRKEDILPKPPEECKKMTLWERLKKVLMG